MSGLRREDYLLRQARAVGAMLARIAGFRKAGQTDEARIELEHAYGELLGQPGALLRQLDVRTAADILDAPETILCFARLLNEEAEQKQDEARRASMRLRALGVAFEAARRDLENAEIRGFVKEVASSVDPAGLTDEQREYLSDGDGPP